MAVDGVERATEVALLLEVVRDAQVAGTDVVEEGLLQQEGPGICWDFAL